RAPGEAARRGPGLRTPRDEAPPSAPFEPSTTRALVPGSASFSALFGRYCAAAPCRVLPGAAGSASRSSYAESQVAVQGGALRRAEVPRCQDVWFGCLLWARCSEGSAAVIQSPPRRRPVSGSTCSDRWHVPPERSPNRLETPARQRPTRGPPFSTASRA